MPRHKDTNINIINKYFDINFNINSQSDIK